MDGRQIQIARQASGFSLQQLADEARLSKSHLSNIENGKIKPSYDIVLRIADVLNLSALDIDEAGSMQIADAWVRRDYTLILRMVANAMEAS